MTTTSPSLCKAFLDTTVPCARVLGSKQRQRAARQKLKSFGALTTSKFVQLEFTLGPYKHLTSFQEKAEGGASAAELAWHALRYGSLSPPNKYRRLGNVMLDVIMQFIEKLEATGPTFGPLLCQLQGFLRQLVRRAWRRAFRGVDIIDPSGCLGDLPTPTWSPGESRMVELATEDYLSEKAEGLANFVRKESPQFQSIHDALKSERSLKEEAETQKRIEAINKILAGAEATAGDIRYVGDALVAVECPPGHVLLNNNVKHFAPITAAIQKPSQRL